VNENDVEPDLDPAVRQRTLLRFEQHRRSWQQNQALRTLYTRWYGLIRERLPPAALGPWVELGSGPGFAAEVIPEMQLTDVVQAPWHVRQTAAERLPFADGAVGALVLFDVLHHLSRPAAFFEEASRVLPPGGRVVMCEPFISPLSFPLYRFFHEERCDFGVDPYGDPAKDGDPFDGNQAVPTMLLDRGRQQLLARFPSFRLVELTHLAGPAYAASGGFSRRALPSWLWRPLLAMEDRLPEAAFRLIGFRLLAVLERR
jgi:SAM-dependent methyltransferase